MRLAIALACVAAACSRPLSAQHFAAITVGPRAAIQNTNPLRCTFPDGTTVPGTCMFDDEFEGTSLSSQWHAIDDWEGPIQNVAPSLSCFRHENVSVSGGQLHLAMTANARASCPQTWTASSYYTTNYGTSWPPGQPTSFDEAAVDTPTFHFRYGHVWIKARAPSGTGPGMDVSLWGTNCQNATTGIIGQYLTGFFAHNGTCQFPSSGSYEMDIPNFLHANGNLNCSIYRDSGNSAPLVGTFFGVNYYGALWSNQIGVGNLFLAGNPAIDPTDGMHVYETIWGPDAWSFYVDGTMLAVEEKPSPNWVNDQDLFPMIWNADQAAVTGATLPQSVDVEAFRIWCDPGVPCTWSQ